ncbi:diaminopimelate epimerase [Chloroflexota bacterium]
MKFTKMQGAGNDYVLIETSGNSHDWSKMATIMCDRRYGIGADSLLLLLPSAQADIRMRVFDADGSEAEACGNGIRCLGRYAYEKGIVASEVTQIRVETLAGIRTLCLNKEHDTLKTIRANMGKPMFLPEEIPVSLKDAPGKTVDINTMLSYTVSVASRDLTLNLISMGNPHAVYFQQQPVADFPLSVLGPKVEKLAIFPNRTNFEVVRVLRKNQVEARVWERGVGETMACGSGACAILAAAHTLGLTGKRIDVSLPGGTLSVEWNGSGEVLLSGPAETVFTGEWPD